MKAQVFVKLKSGVLDPQGLAIEKSLHSLGHQDVVSVKQGKFFDVELATQDRKQAEILLAKISETLLANTVIENFEVKIL